MGAGIKVGQQIGVQSDDVRHGHKRGQTSDDFRTYIGAIFFQFEKLLEHRSYLS